MTDNSELNYTEARLRKMHEELTSCGRIDVYSADPGDLTTEFENADEAFDEISAQHGLELSPSLQHCFFRFEEISAHWRFEEDGLDFAGEFCLSHLVEAVGADPLPTDLEMLSESERQLYSELHPLDEFPNSGADTFAALRIRPGDPQPEVLYYDFRVGGTKLDIDYCGYIDALTITKGTFGWQYLFSDVTTADNHFAHVVENLQGMLEIFPQLFPEYDYAPLRARLEARL